MASFHEWVGLYNQKLNTFGLFFYSPKSWDSFNRNTWEYTDGKDIKDITSAIGGYHYKKIYKNIKSEICVLVDEYQSPGDYRPTYIYYIIYIKNVAFL